MLNNSFLLADLSHSSKGRLEVIPSPLHTALHCVLSVSLYLVEFVKFFGTEHITYTNSQAWSGALNSEPECLGCGMMMSTGASAVQFTLGAKCEHVCVT